MTARARRGGTFGARLSAARLEALLAAAVQGGILLLLLTPLVLTPSTYFPFVVGKAVYARSVIEIVVGLWVVLALLAPAYRPRRSLVLVLLGAGIAAALASAFMGASPQRSLWSSYERMQGVVETAHWAALALAAACTLQAARQWRVLFNCSLAVGAAVAVIAICQGLGVTGLPFYGTYIAVGGNRAGGTLGNPIYLSAYLLINAVLACGLLARSFARDPAPADAAADGRRQGRAARRAAGRRRTPTPDERKRQRRAVLWRTFWLAALAVHLWAVEMAGSLGPILGAAGGVGALALACLALARRRRTRLLGMGLVCALALVLALPVVLQATGTKSIARSVDSQVLRRLLRLDFDNMTVRTRLAAWQAGFAGFADRPLFGWGPENFLVVFGRHGEEFPKRMQPHDAAHSAFVEELATKGAVGAGIYLALWAAAVVVLLRAAGVARGRERMLVLTVGTALMTYLASTQSLFATTVGSMQFALLIAFVAGLEMRTRPAPGNRWTVPRGLPVPAAVVVGCLVGAGLYTNQAIHAAGGAFLKASMAPRAVSQARERYDAAIDAFRPIASDVYIDLFREFARRLQRAPAPAGTALPWLDLRAAEALAAEPDNWLLHLALAQLYLAAAEQHPQRLQDGRRHAGKVLQLVPTKRGALSVMGTPPQPRGLRYSVLADAVELQWRPALGALTYVVDERLVDERTGPGRWQRVYEGVASRATLPVRGAGTRIYRVKACLGRGNCVRGSERVAVRVEAAGPAPRPDAAPPGGVDESGGA